MLRFLERNGFWGVFVLAAIPNPAFDLCGIFCGQTNLPFWTFFIATLLGKMAVKVRTGGPSNEASQSLLRRLARWDSPMCG
eukprot:2251550-Prorocentrum_lima.AAC.1